MTEKQARAIYESGLWKDMPSKDRCWLMLESGFPCYPFGQFHEDLEACLGRPVGHHELALVWKEVKREFLGKVEPPSFQAIIDLIPKEKLIIVDLP